MATTNPRHWHGAKNFILATASAVLAFAVSLSTASAASVTIPGYAPEIGIEHIYRSKKSASTDMSMWFDDPAAAGQINYGDFRQRVTITETTQGGLLQEWKLSADLPPDSSSQLEMNTMFRNSLAAYGIDQVGIETDLSGTPVALRDRDKIIANMKKIAASAPGGLAASQASGLNAIIEALERNPLAIIEALVPEAMYLSVPQSNENGTYETGQSWEIIQEENVAGVAIPVTSTWKVESTDPAKQTVTMSWKQVSDPVLLAQSQQASVDKFTENFSERMKNMTSEQRAYVRSASKIRDGSAVISLRDGASVELNEVLTIIQGGIKIVSKVHIIRER